MPTISKIIAPPAKIAPRKRVAAYARVSDATESLLHSLSAQVSHYRQMIQAHPEWEYAGAYVDEGVTGTSIDRRSEFKRLIADCDLGKIDLILVKSVSRLARDTVDSLKTIRHLNDIGVEVRFEREGISSFSADGELLLTLLAAFAQAESESISTNIKWSIRKRFEKGIPNGHKAPYGYKWDGEMFRIIPEQGEVVKEIFRQYIAGESGYSIAKNLKKRGIKGQKGGPMCDTTIKDIISNISYTGTMILQKNFFTDDHVRKRNRGEYNRYAVEEMFEPLITTDEFEQAKTIRERRAQESASASAVSTQYSGLIKCGNCGSGISRRSFKSAKRWVCNTRERKGKGLCDMRPVMEAELEKATVSVLGKVDDTNFRRQVKRILVFGDRLEFWLANGRKKSVVREYGGYKVRNGFSGKLFCGECGWKLCRKTVALHKAESVEKSYRWCCTGPRCSCSLKRLPEEELRRATASVLGTTEYEPAFVETVKQAIVFNNCIQYKLKDGMVKTWQRE